MNKETEKLYKEREKRYNDAIALKETDRVPVMSPEGVLPLVLNGATNKDAFYNHQKAIQASVNFLKLTPSLMQPFLRRFTAASPMNWPRQS
ncbi:hypothetical protein LC724_02170 [Blautia sp. RD014234]|nr:hypothetical protein [Blautia parvula]